MLREGIYGYMILAVLDSRTSRKCRIMDHMKFKTEDMEVGVTCPPFHPRCRTVIQPIKNKSTFDTIDAKDLSSTRAARDPITGKTYITENVSYPQWAKEKFFKENFNEELDNMGETKSIHMPNKKNPIVVHRQGNGKIYSSNYKPETQSVIKYMDKNLNKLEKDFGEVDEFVILSQKQLGGGLGAFDRNTNTIYIASELGDREKVKELLKGDYFAANTLEEAIIHEFAHKKHRQAIKDLYENAKKGYNSIKDAEEEFNRPIREFIKGQLEYDPMYMNRISRNAKEAYDLGNVFEYVSELFVNKYNGNIKSAEKILLKDVFEL